MKGLYLGIDSSTTATKVIAWDHLGQNMGEGRCDIPMENPAPGFYEQNPNDWWASLVGALSQLGEKIDLKRISALAISNQRETVCFLSKDGEPVAPAIVWLDERSKSEIDSFASKIGEEEIHRISGKHKDITPVVYRLAWMRKHAAQVSQKISLISDVQGFLVHRLTGAFRTSWASADPMGCWDIVEKRWSEKILEPLGWDENNFPVAEKPGSLLGSLTEEAAAQTGLPKDAQVIAGGGDGQCAGLGVGVVRPGSAYINVGTAAVCGAHQKSYAYGKAWRTMTSMSGEGYIMESCLRTGAFLIDWLMDDIYGCSGGAEDFAAIESKAAQLPPGADGLYVLPYWSGVMNPHWNSDARGAIFGLSGRHGREHIYRAVAEGVSLDLAFCLKELERQTNIEIKQYYAVGGCTQSDLWCQILADCLDGEICRIETVEASSLGAGMAAAAGVGAHSDLKEASDKMRGPIAERFAPGENAGHYADMFSVYATLYPATESVAKAHRLLSGR